MKKLFARIGERIRAFRQGRYGDDEISVLLCAAALILLLLSLATERPFLVLLALALIVLSWLRSLSRNLEKRRAERERYLRARSALLRPFRVALAAWRERRTHRYYRCPHCKATVRIRRPERGKTIRIRCTRCGRDFEKRT